MQIIKKLNESKKINQTITESDLFAFINDSFPDNPKSWKYATDELPTIVKSINDKLFLDEQDGFIKSKSPSEFNKHYKHLFFTKFSLLNDYNKKLIINEYSNWVNEWKIKKIQTINVGYKKLNESQQFNKQLDDVEFESILSLKKNQFEFESGVFMATLPNKIDSKFGLFWHAINNVGFDNFLKSVSEFIESTTQIPLSELDIEKLQLHYNKYFQE